MNAVRASSQATSTHEDAARQLVDAGRGAIQDVDDDDDGARGRFLVGGAVRKYAREDVEQREGR